MKKKNTSLITVLFLLLLLGLNDSGFAQLKSVTPLFNYTGAVSMRQSVEDASAYGGGVKFTFVEYNDLGLSLIAGYKKYDVNQKRAIEQWGWRFWDARYESKINADVSADPALSFELDNIQEIDVIPVIINVQYSLHISEDFSILPSASFGILFYTRKLYVVENWTKEFPDVGHSFSYSYRNFAPDKQGNPLAYGGGLELNFRFSDTFSVSGGMQYLGILQTEGEFGYDNYPLDSELSVQCGLIIEY